MRQTQASQGARSPFAGFALRECANLRRSTVALLSGLQESVSAHGPPVDAVGGGNVEQTGRVHLLQEPAELLLAAAAELLRIHKAGRKSNEVDLNTTFWKVTVTCMWILNTPNTLRHDAALL